MKYFLILFLFGASICYPVSAQTTVWRADDLYKAEIETWFDLFSLTSGWNNTTNNDAGIQFSRNGLAGLGGAWWPIHVNGVRVETQAWDTKSMYLLPFNLSQLDSVVVVEEPMLYDGVFTEKGGVFLYTKKPKIGFQTEGNFSFGNKSGDPGPYVYTEHISPNVERVGPISDAVISFRNQKFGIQGGGSFLYRAPSDDLLHYLRSIPYEHSSVSRWEQVKIPSYSGFLEANYFKENATHSVLLGGTKTEDYLYTNVYSLEVPVDRSFGFISLQGNGSIAENFSMSYKFGHNIQRTSSYPNKRDYWLNWNQDITSAKVKLVQKFRKGHQSVWLQGELLSLRDGLAEKNLSSKVFSPSYAILYNLTDNIEVEYNGKAVHIEETALKHRAGLKINFSDRRQNISMYLSHSGRLPGEDNSLWFWVSEKGFAQDTLKDIANVVLPDKSKYMSAKLGWQLTLDKLSLSVAGVLSKHEDEYIPYVEVMLDRNTTVRKDFNFINDFDATFFRLPLKFNYNINNKIYQQLNYTYSKQLYGREEVFSMLPTHRVSYFLNWKPVQSLKLWTRIQAQSSSSWSYLSSLDEVEVTGGRLGGTFSDTYDTDSASRLLIDIGMKKYIWDQKLAFSIDLRNVLDQHFRYAPLSSENRFTLFLKAHLNLP